MYDPERLCPGYLFVAPYSQLEAKQITDPAEAYITGPMIYDHNGVRRRIQMLWKNADTALAPHMDWIYHVSWAGRIRLQNRDV